MKILITLLITIQVALAQSQYTPYVNSLLVEDPDCVFCFEDKPLAIPTIEVQPHDLSLTTGDNAYVYVGAKGNPDLTYQWYKDSILIPGEAHFFLELPAVTAADVGNYRARVSNSEGAVVSGTAEVTVDEVATPPGFFAAPGVTAGTGTGTYTDPWNLRDILLDDAPLPVGATLLLKPGVYDDPQPGVSGAISPQTGKNYLRRYVVNMDDVIIKPYAGYYTAKILGGFWVNGSDLTIEGLLFENPDDPPGLIPTVDGTPYPGAPGAYNPAEFQDWGDVGIYNGAEDPTYVPMPVDSNNNKYIACVSYGGAGGYSNFKGHSIEYHGCVSYNQGWRAASRVHGHNVYVRNPSVDPAEANWLKYCILSCSGISGVNPTDPMDVVSGQYAGHFYAESVSMPNFLIIENFFVGDITIQSETLPGIDGIIMANNIAVAHQPHPVTREFGFGRPWTDPLVPTPGTEFWDNDFTLTGNTFIDGLYSAYRNNFTTLVSSNNWVIKTDPTWTATGYPQPPAVTVAEDEAPYTTNTFSDYSAGGGTDFYNLYQNEYNSDIAVLVLVDLDLDGTVSAALDIDFNLNPYLGMGDTYSIVHYQDVEVVVQSGTYDGSSSIPINLIGTSVKNGVTDLLPADAFIVFKTN